jgi:hypothetical protein
MVLYYYYRDMIVSCGYGGQQIDDANKCREITGNFDCHGDAAVQFWAHSPMDHIQGFN